MNRYYFFLTLLAATNFIYGQTNKIFCDCPKTQYTGTKPDTSFYLTNGNAIVLCGYRNPDIEPVTFSEFILAVCGHDTIIGFREAEVICRLKTIKDSLLIEELKYLPVGENFAYDQAVWTIERIYFSKNKIDRKLSINKGIHKYADSEIQSVLKEFETSEYGMNDKNMELAHKLFIATISGDKTARKYFQEFENKFGTLNGAFAEEYEELVAILSLWDSN
ncbi:MAG TPA: hypothetical protein VE978_03360 [Chitinophagales bacterium]|nr:hypothetical protein [Chitinophagales bacterium]